MLHDLSSVIRTGLFVGLACCLFSGTSLYAQPEGGEKEKLEAKPAGTPEAPPQTSEQPPEAKKVEAEPAPAEKQPAAKEEPQKEPPTAKPAGSPADAFAAKTTEWKDLLKEMRKLKSDFATAEPAKIAAIQGQWNDLVAKGETLLGELRETGKAVFLAAPNQDHEVMHFLTKLVASDVKRDDYEVAAGVSQALLDNGCTEKDLWEPAGVAAFATNDFDKAEKYLKKAQEGGSLAEPGQKAQGALKSAKENWTKEQALRKQEGEKDDLPRVKLATSKGDIVVELFENEAPGAVGNFISLVEQKFYDGLVFHRVLPGFMAQGGCPKGDGTGDAGYKIRCECQQENARKHFRGSLSMAHAGKDTGGSQFFLTFVPTTFLDGKHTVFGRVIEGMDVLARIQKIDPESKATKPTPDKIITATVIRKRDHEYKPNKVE